MYLTICHGRFAQFDELTKGNPHCGCMKMKTEFSQSVSVVTDSASCHTQINPPTMKLLIIQCAVAFIIWHHVTEAEKLYNGYAVYTVKVENEAQFKTLLQLQDEYKHVDFWSYPTRSQTMDIMVEPNDIGGIERFLRHFNVAYNITIPDVQTAVDKAKRRFKRQSDMNWFDYQKLGTIYEWLDSLASYNPQLSQVVTIGRSTEGRELKLIKISKRPERNNPAIFIDGGIHAREWISPAVVTYITGKLMSLTSEDNGMLDNIDWHVLPILNPDGYEFTFTEDRLWRKSRSVQSDSDCPGVDLNRNFNSTNWGRVGASDDPCKSTYPGSYPFSEPETNSTANYLLSIRNRIGAYLTFHSYAQLWLTPYGYTENPPSDYAELEDLGLRAARAMENVHGTEYQVGSASQILYLLSGCSQDWVRDVVGVKYSYTVELRDDGDEKFLLSPEHIVPSGEETWEAIKVIARHLHETRADVLGNHNHNNPNLAPSEMSTTTTEQDADAGEEDTRIQTDTTDTSLELERTIRP